MKCRRRIDWVASLALCAVFNVSLGLSHAPRTRPVANAGPDQLGAVGAMVTLDGSGSTDADGDSLTFVWVLTTRPDGSTAVLDDSGAVLPTVVLDEPGIYVAQLVVSDRAAASEPDTVTITAFNWGGDHAQTVFNAGSASPAALDPSSLAGTWRGTTAQSPPQQFRMWVDTGGVVGIDTYVFGTGTGPCGTLQLFLNLHPPVAIANDSFVVNFSVGSIGSGTLTGSFLDATSASGTIDVTLTPGTGCAPIHTAWTATHGDPGPVPVISVEAVDANASEVGQDPGAFTISRSGSLGEDVFVNYVVSGSATSGIDYTSLPFSQKIPAGQSSVTLNVTPINDTEVEGTQTVVLTVSDFPSYIRGTPAAATVSIADNPTPIITVVATDAEAYEAGLDPGTFTFTRVGSTTFPLTVVITITGTATNGFDYNSISTFVTFPALQSEVAVTVTPRVDGSGEPPETVTVTLTDNANYDPGAASQATVTITETPGPATVTVTAGDPNASEVGPDSGTITFARTGSTASALAVNFTTTGGATVVSDYADVGWTSVSIPAGQTSATKTVTPIADSAVEGPESVVVTLAAGAYVIGTPAAATVTIADGTPAGQPNLRVTALQGAAVAAQGGGYTAKDTTHNAGTATAAASATKFYLSVNNTWDAGDTLLIPINGRNVPSLGAGASSVASTTVTLPAGTPPGKRYIIAFADAANTIDEVVESDNTKTKAIFIGPDLVVATLTAPSTAAPGQAIAVGDKTKNVGGEQSAIVTTTRFYLSRNKSLDALDTPLHQGRPVGALAAGASSSSTTSVTIPTGLAAGAYYILAKADDGAALAESQESNNLKVRAITIQ